MNHFGKNRDICEFANQNRKPMSQGGRTKIAELLQSTPAGSEVTAKGWVRTKRGNKNVAFIALNDGSIIHNIQIVVDVNKFDDELLKRNHHRRLHPRNGYARRVAGFGPAGRNPGG